MVINPPPEDMFKPVLIRQNNGDWEWVDLAGPSRVTLVALIVVETALFITLGCLIWWATK